MRFSTMNFLIFLCILISGAFAQIPLSGKTIHIWLPQGDGHTLEVKDGPGNFTTDGNSWYSFTFTSDPWSGVFFTLDGSWNTQIGLNGMSATATRINDTFWEGNSEVWYILEEGGGPGKKLFNQPVFWTLHVLNPDDWKLTAPRILLNKELIAPTLEENCGWFVATFLADASSNMFGLRQAINQEGYGPFGYEDTTTIELNDIFTDGATEIWLETESWNFTKSYPNVVGECPTYELGLTIRDINASAHSDFGTNPGEAPCATINHGMVATALDPLTKRPQYVGNCGVTQFDSWWVKDPAVDNETCRDLPFHKSDDGLWEYDSNDEPNTAYLPIDDFNPYNDWATSLATATFQYNGDGSPVLWPSGDGQEHAVTWTTVNGQFNLGFCMEMHADFIYTPGQNFHFRGDDDLWVFINNKLALDVGGTHNPVSDSINLATLSLTEGQKYDFDMYFCERQYSGTNLRVKTSIYFEQRKALDYVATTNGDASTYTFFRYEGGQGSCQSQAAGGIDSTQATAMTYVLTHRGELIDTLVVGLNFGGIEITAAGLITINVNNIAGLAPGSYKITPYQSGHVEPGRAIEFRMKGSLSFASGDQIGLAGRLIPVVIGNLADGIADPAEIGYYLVIPEGLEVFQDSAGNSPVTGGTLLSTVAETGYDTVWVTGTRATSSDTTTYQLRLKSTATPGVNLNFYLPDIRFVGADPDSADYNTALANPYKLRGRWSYVAYPVRVEVYSEDGHCEVCNDTLQLITGDSLIFLNERGEVVTFIVPDSGFVSFSVMGNADQISGASFVVQGPSTLISITWGGINLIKPPVPMVEKASMWDDNGDGIADRLVIDYRENLDSLPVWLEVNWPTEDSPPRYAQDQLGSRKTGPTQITFTGNFTENILTNGVGTISSMYLFEGEEIISTMPVSDRVGPVILEAYISLGERSDELSITFSEPMDRDSLDAWILATASDERLFYGSIFSFRLGAERLPYSGRPLHSWKDDSTLVLTFMASETESYPGAGDQIRIFPVDLTAGQMGLVDLVGNPAHLSNPWVTIQGKKRSKIISISYREVSELPEGPAEISLRSYAARATLEDIREDNALLGHLLESDLAQYLKNGNFAPEDLILYFSEEIFTNLGGFVFQGKGQISCADAELFDGDCSQGEGRNLFFGWNFKASSGRIVGSGAYIAIMNYHVEVDGHTVERDKKENMWGVLRTD